MGCSGYGGIVMCISRCCGVRVCIMVVMIMGGVVMYMGRGCNVYDWGCNMNV